MNLSTLLFKFLRRWLFDYRATHAPRPMPQKAWRRVALVKVDGIGDFVLATAFLNEFRASGPGADVTLICRAPVEGLARWQFPEWRVVSVPAKVKPLREILRCRATRSALRKLAPYDTLIDLRGYRDAADAAITSWVPASYKVALENGFPPEYGWVALPDEELVFDQYLSRPGRDRGTCEDIAGHRRLAESLLNSKAGDLLPALRVSREEKGALRQKLSLRDSVPHLLLCPGTSIPQKEYPPAALAAAIQSAKLPQDWRIVIAGGANDARTIGPLKAALGRTSEVLDVSGRLSMVENAILISTMTAVVAMDSCHAHIAGATGTPALILLTGQQRGFFGPWNESPTFRWQFSSAPQTAASQPFLYNDYLTSDTLPVEVVAEEISALLRVVRP